MTKYRAIIVLPAGASEGRFEFDAPEGFMQNAPSRIVDTFLSTVSGLDLPSDPVESEINSAHNFRDTQTVRHRARSSCGPERLCRSWR